MKVSKMLYRDVMDYSPIDVIKGIDLVTKEIVMADDPAPEGYRVKPKCKFCKNFLTDDKNGYLGTCKASKINFMAYPDMTATTCKDYERTDI
jgi:hypothetical protein